MKSAGASSPPPTTTRSRSRLGSPARPPGCRRPRRCRPRRPPLRAEARLAQDHHQVAVDPPFDRWRRPSPPRSAPPRRQRPACSCCRPAPPLRRCGRSPRAAATARREPAAAEAAREPLERAAAGRAVARPVPIGRDSQHEREHKGSEHAISLLRTCRSRGRAAQRDAGQHRRAQREHTTHDYGERRRIQDQRAEQRAPHGVDGAPPPRARDARSRAAARSGIAPAKRPTTSRSWR